jgi:hypothetical protein
LAVNFTFYGQPHERAAAELAVFGHALENAEYAELGGNLLEDAETQVWYNQPWSVVNGISRIRTRIANQAAVTNVRMIPGRFEYSECRVFAPGQKTGAQILQKIALAAKARGFAVLTGSGEKATNAAGELTSWGFYASPRMGFDAPIPPATPARPAALAGCLRLSELMATPAGRAFWKAHGVQVPYMEFDLADGSLSWQTLDAYLAPPVAEAPAAAAPEAQEESAADDQ